MKAFIFWLVVILILGISAWAKGETIKASWYGNESIVPKWGGYTASGEKFNEEAFTCARPTRDDLGKIYLVTYKDKQIKVRANDTGSFGKYVKIDLTKGAFKKLAPLEKGIIEVDLKEIK